MPDRKPTRIPGFAYDHGAWFVTICTQNRIHRFGAVHGVGDGSPVPHTALSHAGMMVERYINMIPEKYPTVTVTDRVIMPDHIHMILLFEPRQDGPGNPAPTLGNVIGWFKYQTTKSFNAGKEPRQKLWQRNYYEHGIRNHADYLACVEYIRNNPAAWAMRAGEPGPYSLTGEGGMLH